MNTQDTDNNKAPQDVFAELELIVECATRFSQAIIPNTNHARNHHSKGQIATSTEKEVSNPDAKGSPQNTTEGSSQSKVAPSSVPPPSYEEDLRDEPNIADERRRRAFAEKQRQRNQEHGLPAQINNIVALIEQEEHGSDQEWASRRLVAVDHPTDSNCTGDDSTASKKFDIS